MFIKGIRISVLILLIPCPGLGFPKVEWDPLKARMSSSSLVDGGGGRMRDKEGKEASKCVMTLPQWGTATD